MRTQLTINQALDYEVASSFWASWISNHWLQDKVASYYAWKVRRKYGRYVQVKEMGERIMRSTSNMKAEGRREDGCPT